MNKKHLLKTVFCPKCGKRLVNFSLRDGEDCFFCEKCNIDIVIQQHEDKYCENHKLYTY